MKKTLLILLALVLLLVLLTLLILVLLLVLVILVILILHVLVSFFLFPRERSYNSMAQRRKNICKTESSRFFLDFYSRL